jgi:hypothetical protein
MLDMMLNSKIEEPYNKFPPDGPVAIISKSLVKARLSSKFMEITNKEEPREEYSSRPQSEDLQQSGMKKSRLASGKKVIDQDDLDTLREQIAMLKDELRVR